MSDSCSFTSEYIYHENDYKKLRELFDKCQDNGVCTAPPAKNLDGSDQPIIQGQISGTYGREELLELMDMMRNVELEHPVRFVILTENPVRAGNAMYVVDFGVDYWPFWHSINESYIHISEADKYELENNNYYIKEEEK